MELVAEGQNPQQIGQFDNMFHEQEHGKIRFYLDKELTPDELIYLETEIKKEGVCLLECIRQDARILAIGFEQRIPALLIIGGVIATVVTSLLGWQIFKTTQLGVPLWIWVVGGGALLYLLFSSKPAKQAGGVAIQAGKVYLTRKAAG
jgi:hypothetical protein